MAHYKTLISVDELVRSVEKFERDVVIFDCRFRLDDVEFGERNYLEAHIPAAHYAHLDRNLSGVVVPGRTGRHPLPDPETFKEFLRSCGVSTASQVVAYDDRGGAIAARLWWMLKWISHERVAVLDGGWQGWLAAGQPTASGRTKAQRTGDLVARPRAGMAAEANELMDRASSLLLVDARSRDRYEGRDEPIDPVAGHIPGAISAPFVENLDENLHFRSIDELRARFRSVVGESPAQNVVCYCGSGVTAAHDVLAIAHAGLGLVRLYPGSWSEWITDESRAVARSDRE